MRDRTPTQVINGAVRVAIHDDKGNFVRYEWMKRADEPTEPGTPLTKANLLDDTVAKNLRMSQSDPTVNQALDTIRQNTYVSRDTAASMGYPGDITVDQALQTLSVGTNNYAYKIYLKTAGGRPLAGATISGFKDKDGKAIVATTDENGYALGLSNTQTTTITATTKYIDQPTSTFTITAGQIGTYKDFTLKMARISPASKTWTANANNLYFSDDVDKFSASVCGGGGGAGGSYVSGHGYYEGDEWGEDPSYWYPTGNHGSAGAGGHTANKANVSYNGNAITITIGAGGNSSGTEGAKAGTGGTSSIKLGSTTVVTADGGEGGTSATSRSVSTTRASGNGNGAYHAPNSYGGTTLTAGTAATESFLYPSTPVGGGGALGGRARGGVYQSAADYDYVRVVAPGNPNGGEYGFNNPGVGGGGAAYLYAYRLGSTSQARGLYSGQSGGKGLAGMTWTYKANVG